MDKIINTNHSFSVLMSVYYKDNPCHLKVALESLYFQELLPNEIILVKDGLLNKELDQIIDSFVERKNIDFKIIELKKNSGLAIALAKGLENCSYEYVARMDADDISKPDRFRKQISFLTKNPDICIVGSWIEEFIDKIENIVSIRKVPDEHDEILEYLKGRCPFNHPTVMFNKSDIIDAGGYRHIYLKEDMDLWLRLYERKKIFANIPESLLFFRITKDTFKRRGGLKYAISEYKIFKKKLNIGLINYNEFIYYLLITLPIRLAPSFLRNLIYTKFLR